MPSGSHVINDEVNLTGKEKAIDEAVPAERNRGTASANRLNLLRLYL